MVKTKERRKRRKRERDKKKRERKTKERKINRSKESSKRIGDLGEKKKQQNLKKKLRNWFLKGFTNQFMFLEKKTSKRMLTKKL